MLRQTILRQSRLISLNATAATRTFSQTPCNYGVLDSAKEVLSKANKKIGEAAADGIEIAESVTPTKETVVNAADAVNKKTGKVLADGIEVAEKVTPTKDNITNAADTVNKKTGKVLADGIDKAEKLTPDADDVSKTAGNAADAAKDRANHAAHKAANIADKGGEKASELVEDGVNNVENATSDAHHAKKKVKDNHQGYKDLQDKGAKTETEQNRPDDAV